MNTPAKNPEIAAGRPVPLGATPAKGGVNFALFSRHATGIELLIYDSGRALNPAFTIRLDAEHHRSGDIWHVWVNGVGPGWYYMYRVYGPYAPQDGVRFNPRKLVADPHAAALCQTSNWDFSRARGYDSESALADLSLSLEDNAGFAARACIASQDFGWREERPLKHSWEKTVIYETHVRGLTIHPSSGAVNPGTYRGLMEKIPYFKQLGISAVELLPIQEFNERELTSVNPSTGEPLRNYWGYSTIGFFAPKESYAGAAGNGAQIAEFKEMVRALHREGIELILDVVFNHTAEGNEFGPTLSFRGLDNPIYYLLEHDRRRYRNYSGCGNTLNCNHPILREFIRTCLRYWVVEMRVDGFRFDLASILGRDELGNVISNPPLLESIAEDPFLRDVKLIAEAWDAGGAYQVGTFPGNRWSEWNGRYRDDVRRYWRGDSHMAAAFASRLCGSADIYQRSGKQPVNSVNFVTCHDGFTLRDLVSYQTRHNEANGESNLDGTPENFSCNYGIEGETDVPEINAVRRRQMKNLLATLFLSRGIPMLLGGDEFGRTQGGNNNAYCQDNEVSWYDWRLQEQYRDLHRFVRSMISFRSRHPILSELQFYTEEEVVWFDPAGARPDWHAAASPLGCIIHRESGANRDRLCLLFNPAPEAVLFRIPAMKGKIWRLAVDTMAAAPGDIDEHGRLGCAAQIETYSVGGRSLVVLVGEAPAP